MDYTPKTVMEVECEIPTDLFNEVVVVGKDTATDQDFFNIGCAFILEDRLSNQNLPEETEE